MGFDNECIPNIQSLAGEYFCPVCRLLVYPNEALQSQCTHLYCKACLTYVVSTTRACPYDGYLVTEADSKPLIESNKALAETIGNITVHCLYQRSGCTWQGNLSECTSHCSGCAFGNSPVVCNRCGVQIIHRQVQEHAQSCPGVQPQAQNVQSTQDATTTTTATTSEHTQAIILPATSTTQLHTSQTTTTSQPGQDPSQQANTKVQTVVSAAVPTAEQWYQQQQQYQQYYQQYAAYQQQYYQYYPYHQQAIPPYQQSQVYVQPQASQVQLQPNLQLQPQAQLQTQPQLHVPTQLPVAAQPQTQALVNPQQQTHTVSQPQSQIQPPVQLPTHGYSHPQSQPLSQNQTAQPYPQLVPPQYQQPHVQMQQAQPQIQPPAHSQFQPQHIPIPQPQPHLQGQSLRHAQHHPLPLSQPVTSQPNQPLIPNLLSQSQNPSASAVTDPHTHLQVHQQVQLGAPQHPLHMHLQVGPRPQSQLPIQPPSQYPQQPPLLRPPQSHGTSQNQQQGLLPSPGQVPVVHPAQQLPGPYAHQPGVHVHQFPAQQPMHQEYPQHQQLFAGQPLGPVQNQGNQQGPFIQQQLHGQSQLRPQGPQQPFQQNLQAYQQPQHNFSLPNTIQHHPAQSPAGWPTMPPQVVPTQPHSQSLVGIQLRPGQSGGNQQSGNILRTESHVQSSSEQLSRANLRPFSERHDHNDEKGAKAELSSHHAAERVALDLGTDGGEMKRESEVKLEDVSNEPIGETKDSPKSLAADNGGLKKVKEEPTEGTVNQKDVSDVDKELSVTEGKEMKDVPQLKTPSLQEGEHLDRHGTKFHKEKKVVNQIYRGFRLHGQEQEGGLGQSSHSVPAINQGWQNHPGYHGPFDLQQGPVGPPLLQAPSPGRPHHAQLPEHPSTQLRPLGPGCTGFPGQPLNPLSEHPQQPGYKHPYGPEVLNAAITAPVSTSGFGRGPSRGPLPEGPYTQGKQSLSHGEAEMFPNQRPGYIDGRRADPLGQQSSMHSNSVGMNESIVRDSSPMLDRRHRALPNERFNPFPQDLSRRNIAREEFEGDLKHLPRPSHLNADVGPVVRGNFSLPGPLDRGQHGFRMDPAGSAPSRLFPPYPYDGVLHSNDAVDRPVPGYVHRHRDGLGPRSPGGDFPGLPSRRFGAFHRLDNVDGGELDRFDSISRSFHDSRFPTFPGHLRGGEYDGPGNLRRGEHLSGSQDGLHNHLQRGEHLGPHDLPRHLRLEGFVAAFPGHARMGDFSRRVHPLLGEPGFRSNYSLKRFPADGGSYAGDFESYDNSRKRKASSMGWCRICKVDCETVEGLDVHSQTREHQKMSLDIVLTIKQNAKKQKLDSYALDVESKPKNVSSEDSGSKQ